MFQDFRDQPGYGPLPLTKVAVLQKFLQRRHNTKASRLAIRQPSVPDFAAAERTARCAVDYEHRWQGFACLVAILQPGWPVNLEGAAIGCSEVDAEVTHLETASRSGRARMPLDSSSSITS